VADNIKHYMRLDMGFMGKNLPNASHIHSIMITNCCWMDWLSKGAVVVVDTERGVNQYQVQFKNLFQLILKPFNYIQ